MALAHAARLLGIDPRLAAEQAREILQGGPGHPHARLILGQAHRIAGRTHAALEALEPLASEQPHASAVFWNSARWARQAGEPGRLQHKRRAASSDRTRRRLALPRR